MPCIVDFDDAVVLHSLNFEEEQNINFLKHPCSFIIYLLLSIA